MNQLQNGVPYFLEIAVESYSYYTIYAEFTSPAYGMLWDQTFYPVLTSQVTNVVITFGTGTL